MSHLSRAEARSKEREAQADRTRKLVEEPDRAASVQILEDEQRRTNGVPNRESGQSRPVADPEAKAWLEEAYGSLSERDKQSFARETERFRATEEGI